MIEVLFTLFIIVLSIVGAVTVFGLGVGFMVIVACLAFAAWMVYGHEVEL